MAWRTDSFRILMNIFTHANVICEYIYPCKCQIIYLPMRMSLIRLAFINRILTNAFTHTNVIYEYTYKSFTHATCSGRFCSTWTGKQIQTHRDMPSLLHDTLDHCHPRPVMCIHVHTHTYTHRYAVFTARYTRSLSSPSSNAYAEVYTQIHPHVYAKIPCLYCTIQLVCEI